MDQRITTGKFPPKNKKLLWRVYDDVSRTVKIKAFIHGEWQDVSSGGGGGSGVTIHNLLSGRTAPDSHNIGAVTNLQKYIDEYIWLGVTTPNPTYTRYWL